MSNSYEMEELARMKRSELQKLAKQHGIKANMKTDGLIKALAAVVVGSNLEGNNIVPAASSEEEATTTSASSTEDQSEVEASQEKPKARRGRGRKQKNVKQTIKESPVKDTKTDVVAGGDNAVVTAFPTPESESQTSSVTEDEVSPVAKKSKAKSKGRGRGRRGRQTKEEPVEEKKTEQEVAPVAAVISSPAKIPAVPGRRSRSLQRTSAVNEPTLPTPPNSGSSRKTKRAIRRTTHTPQPAAPAQPTPSTQTPNDAPSSNKRSSRGANKTPLMATPKTTPAAIKTTTEPKPRGSTGKRSASGSAGGKAKKVRRGTFDKSPAKEVAVEAAKSSSTLKDEIMAEIDRKVQIQVAKSKSCIPTRVQATKKKTPGKNWSKTHHGALDKMESIDSYLERKQRRAEAISASKKPRIPAVTKPVLKAAKSFNFASPKPGTTKSQTFNFASPKPTKATMPINPKSVNPKTVSFKVSKLKTPKKVILPSSVAAPVIDKRKATPGVRKSISALTPGSGVRKSIGGATPVNDRKSFGAARTPSRKSVGGAVTPFGKTAASATKPNNIFDIKASLSKPLAYKPHTGKLKPFGETQQNSPSNLSKAKALIKKPQLKGRDIRRAGNRMNRAQKRNDSYMANRGIAGC
eukprot:XP_782158.3 PREDICTED: nucleolar and spindle-associated protein 1-A isoform X1 [Strongylocentrotus purpuratus]